MPDRTIQRQDSGADLGIRFVLEHVTVTGARKVHELSWVESVQDEQIMLANIRFPVDAKIRPVIQRSRTRRIPIVLSGATGVESRPSTRDGGKADLDGLGRITALRAFLAGYRDEAINHEGLTGRSEAKPQLLLHALYEGVAWDLATADLQVTQSTEDAVGDFVFTLRCVAVGLIERETAVLSPLDNDPQTNPQRSAGYAEQQKAIVDARAKYAAEIEALRNGEPVERSWIDEWADPFDHARLTVERGIVVLRSVQGVQARLRGGIDRANLLLSRVAEARTVFHQIGEFPLSLFSAALAATDYAVQEIAAVIEELSVTGINLFGDQLRLLSESYNHWRLKASAEMGRARLRAVDTDGSADIGVGVEPVAFSSGTPVRVFYATVAVNTLERIAATVLGDGSRWAEIAAVNGIDDAWALQNGAPALAPGTVVFVPVADGAPLVVDDLIGESFYINAEGDMEFGGDSLLRIRGVPLVVQAITERAQEVRPKCAAAPEWGLIGLNGTAATPDDAARYAVDARAQFQRDPRVRGVSGLRLSRSADTTVLTLDLLTVGGESEPFVVSLIAR